MANITVLQNDNPSGTRVTLDDNRVLINQNFTNINDELVATTAAVAGKAPAGTGTSGAVTKSDVGLSNVDNTSDINKPVSTAQAAAIDAKYTRPGSGIPASDLDSATQATLSEVAGKAPAGSGTGGAITKSDVGLGNANNTSDADKPVSTAQATAINAKYTKPGTGIPATDLDADTQSVLTSAVRVAPTGSLDDRSRAALVASGYSGWSSQIRVITIGDSITQYGSASGWMLYVEMTSNRIVRVVKDAAVAGETVDQMIARFSTDVTPYADQADELWIMAGTNNAALGESNLVFAPKMSTLIDLGIATGLRVRVFNIPPRDNVIPTANRLRECISAVAMKKGVNCYDPWQACINPATGGYNAADTIDGVHPSASGHTKAGQAVVALLNIPTTHAITLPVQNAANGGMMTNPLFVTDSNSDGAADGWGFSGGGVPSLVASTFGNKQRFTATALTGPTYMQNNPILTVVPGNVYSVKGKLTVSGTDHNWYLRIRWQTSASLDTGNTYPWNGQANATGEFEFRVTAPADATKLAVQFSLLKQAAKSSYSAVLDIEQFQIVDLTAIGLS